MKATCLFLLVAFLNSPSLATALPNGFPDQPSLIDTKLVFKGGPPRDGIPSIDRPKFLGVNESTWLDDRDLVVALKVGDISRAYALRILVWHEIVNDKIQGKELAITYCPLCGSSVVFESPKHTSFGVSGLLYQSDVLMYDRRTKSLWSQLEFKAVIGERAGEELKLYPSAVVFWKDWKEANPNGQVLSRDTGFRRDYRRDPYLKYKATNDLMFPVKNKDNRLNPKEQVFVVQVGETFKAYPMKLFGKNDKLFNDQIEKRAIKIKLSSGLPQSAVDASNKALPSFTAFWFAWYTFKPDTELYTK